jgi:hypothetical protein
MLSPLERRKLDHAEAAKIIGNDGWLVSLPGMKEILLQTLPGSDVPDRLRQAGFVVSADGSTTRVVANATSETIKDHHNNVTVREHAGTVQVDCFIAVRSTR